MRFSTPSNAQDITTKLASPFAIFVLASLLLQSTLLVLPTARADANLTEGWENGFGDWQRVNDGSSIDCTGPAHDGSCSLQFNVHCCSHYDEVTRAVNIPTSGVTTASFFYTSSGSAGSGSTDAGFVFTFSDGKPIHFHYTNQPGRTGAGLLIDSGYHTIGSWSDPNAWHEGRVVFDPIAQTVTGQLLQDGVLLGTSDAVSIPEGIASTITELMFYSVTWNGDPDTYHVDSVSVSEAPALPGAVQNLVALAGASRAALSWQPPADDGGATITSYNVYRGDSPGAETLLSTGSCSNLAAVLSCNDTNLENQRDYYYQVAGVNSAGEGPRSPEVTVRPNGIPNFLSAITFNRGRFSDQAQFGVNNSATDGFDPGTDSPHAPVPPSDGYASAAFHYAGNAPETQDLATSVVPPTGEVVFPLHLSWSDQACCPGLGLQWDSQFLQTFPSNVHVLLLDGSTSLDMKSTSSRSLGYYAYTGSYDMKVVITTAEPFSFGLGSGWNLRSVPLTPDDASMRGVFGSTVDIVKGWDGTGYTSVSTVQPGVGYWVHNTGDATSRAVVGPADSVLNLSLNHGWTLIGGPITGCASLDNAPSGVSRTAFWYDGTGYRPSTSVCPGLGYWIYSDTDGAVLTLNAASSPSSVAPKSLRVPGQSLPAGPEFSVTFWLAERTGSTSTAELRAKNGASSSYDSASDLMAPPRAAASTWAQAYFVTPEGAQMQRDVIPPTYQLQRVLEVTRAGPSTSSMLAWDNSNLPPHYVVELVDGNVRTDMTKVSSYNWTATPGESTRDFTLILHPIGGPVCGVQIDGECAVVLPFDPTRPTL